MDIIQTEVRPNGLLGKLFERVSAYTYYPRGEIERQATLALADGSIDKRRFEVLQSLVPFYGSQRKSPEQLGNKLGVRRQMVERLAHEAAWRLNGYVSRELACGDLEKIHLHDLPWRFGKRHSQACIALGYKIQGKNTTVAEVIALFESLASDHKPISLMNYGKGAHEVTYETFSKIGVELPQILCTPLFYWLR